MKDVERSQGFGQQIWMNGALIDWPDATVHVSSHSLHYGTGVFEGIRAYETDRGLACFRLKDTMRQFSRAAKMLNMSLPYSTEELVAAAKETVKVNDLGNCYIRPLAFYSSAPLSLKPSQGAVEVVIMTWYWDSYSYQSSEAAGVRAKIVSWVRSGPNTIPYATKATGVYLNSVLALEDAQRAGYDEAILLTESGFIADCSGANLFLVKERVVYTPSLAAGILPGSTRDAVIKLAETRGIRVIEQAIIRTDLYTADEVFLASTAAEVTPIRAVDDIEIGDPGPVTSELRDAYRAAATGRAPSWLHWLDFVE